MWRACRAGAALTLPTVLPPTAITKQPAHQAVGAECEDLGVGIFCRVPLERGHSPDPLLRMSNIRVAGQAEEVSRKADEQRGSSGGAGCVLQPAW